MFVFGNFLMAIAHILNLILTIFYWLILIRALVSWVNPDPYNPIIKFLHKTTEPILERVRQILPAKLNVSIDISPIIAFIAILFLKTFVVKTLSDIAMRLR